MPVEFIPAQSGGPPNPIAESVITKIRAHADRIGLGNTIIYYKWPNYTDYDAVRHSVDIAILSASRGLYLIKVLSTDDQKNISKNMESISQATATAISQLVRSPMLRKKGRNLKLDAIPVIINPGYAFNTDDVDYFDSDINFMRFVEESDIKPLNEVEFEEARSILEGAKALTRTTRRSVSNPAEQRAAACLIKLEDEIASFDHRQRQVALTMLSCPQRIRGLAGSGKTVILAMKAALAHLANPDARVLVTFYTRSLRDHLSRLITRFHRHFGEGSPTWERIDIRHGWGRQDLPGVYREACIRAEVTPLTFTQASAEAAAFGMQPFDYACRKLVDTGKVKQFYDLILIDEGQDFPGGFYELCFHLAKGARDTKQIVWAYDELQNVFDVGVRTPEELFGTDADGQPRVSLQRSLPRNAETNDFVLPKSYRNQRDVLVLAHASGFGIYGQPVQMLESKDHWEDVGYDVLTQNMAPGQTVNIRRPDRNSPTKLDTPEDIPLIDIKTFADPIGEVRYIADEFKNFIDQGLDPEDLMAIAVDDRAAQTYLSNLSQELAMRGISSNNIIADRYNEPVFTIEGKCTLSTVYRAKGNEAAVVAVLGCDAVPLDTRSGRNRLFTAFTRTKAWLRITGMAPRFGRLKAELEAAIGHAPEMRFVMPDPARIEQIQRDLSDRDARIQRAREEVDRLKETLSLSDEEIQAIFSEKSGGRA